jgi:hypothetical protein
MHRSSVVALFCLIAFAFAAHAQNPAIAPVHVASGTVLKFHLQTRLKPAANDSMDALPKGTILQVRMIDAIDSASNPDGTEFHGLLAAPLVMGDEIVVPAEAEVQGLLVLLRSRTHPEGFRYELLVTRLTDRGKSYDLTASLNPSFLDPGTPNSSDSKPSMNWQLRPLRLG